MSGPSGGATLALALGYEVELGSFSPGTIKCGSCRSSSSLVLCCLRRGGLLDGRSKDIGAFLAHIFA
jgi:hypothetical protein